MNKDVKDYLKYFTVPFIIVVVIAAIFVGVLLTNEDGGIQYYDSPNTERVYGSQRVFDYGDMLSSKEEEKLEAYIHEKEKETCTDIVVVVLNEPLEFYELEYRSRYQGVTVTPDKWVMVYADKFWEDNKFGYDQPQVLDGTSRTGDGIILVDNNYREGPENKIYTWLGTTGKAERELSSSEIDAILDAFYDEVEYDYYQACIDMVDKYVNVYVPYKVNTEPDMRMPFVIAAIVMVVFIAVNWRNKGGKKTVTPKTYLVNQKAIFTRREDIFLRKSVSKVKIESSSGGGGGGGGHHVSGGGGSHGGGGHSR